MRSMVLSPLCGLMGWLQAGRSPAVPSVAKLPGIVSTIVAATLHELYGQV